MKVSKLLTVLALFFNILLNAQVSEENTQTLESGTIENQFDYLIDKSNRYQDYKVVKRTWLDRLKKVVDDSLNVTRKELSDIKIVLISKESEIVQLTDDLNTTKKNVLSLNNEKDSISLFGLLISKPIYNTILWSIIAILIVLLLIYILRFNRSNSVTKDSIEKFNDLESEFEGYRQRSLEREQQLRRKLQDEINKQKKDK